MIARSRVILATSCLLLLTLQRYKRSSRNIQLVTLLLQEISLPLGVDFLIYRGSF